MKKVEPPWSIGALLICTKCGKSISEDSLKDPSAVAENLKGFLKSELKEKGYGKKIRVVTSSCLDVCQAEFQAVSFCATNGKDSQQMILHPEKEKEELLKFLLDKIK